MTSKGRKKGGGVYIPYKGKGRELSQWREVKKEKKKRGGTSSAPARREGEKRREKTSSQQTQGLEEKKNLYLSLPSLKGKEGEKGKGADRPKTEKGGFMTLRGRKKAFFTLSKKRGPGQKKKRNGFTQGKDKGGRHPKPGEGKTSAIFIAPGKTGGGPRGEKGRLAYPRTEGERREVLSMDRNLLCNIGRTNRRGGNWPSVNKRGEGGEIRVLLVPGGWSAPEEKKKKKKTRPPGRKGGGTFRKGERPNLTTHSPRDPLEMDIKKKKKEKKEHPNRKILYLSHGRTFPLGKEGEEGRNGQPTT